MQEVPVFHVQWIFEKFQIFVIFFVFLQVNNHEVIIKTKNRVLVIQWRKICESYKFVLGTQLGQFPQKAFNLKNSKN